MLRETSIRSVLIAFAIAPTGWMARAAAGEIRSLPTPPHQADPWTPPATRLPRFLVSATRTLFEQGMADPRGCDYRAIEIQAGNIWGPAGGNARTHGWVLPRAKDRDEDFAVGWNGLVYPVLKLGDKADLDADLRALADALKAARADSEARRRPGPFGGFTGANEAFPEGIAVDVGQPLPIKLCLLLRLGRADLAESLFSAGTVWRPDRTGRDLTDYGLSYLTLATDWAWSLFDRAVGAHMRGDDRIALADSRLLIAAREKIETRAAAMGFARPDRGLGIETKPSYLEFLVQLDQLHEDQERRAREPRRGAVPPRGADPARRIAALITDLENVAERQFSQPGWVDLGRAPTVLALVAEGEPAVEPLLTAFESDSRLTRSVAFGRSFMRGRTILGAGEAAYMGIIGILRTREFGANSPQDFDHRSPEGRKRMAALIRAYWRKNKGVSAVERSYRTLRDDAATPAQWEQAAANLLQPPGLNTPPLKPGEAGAPNAEALRDRRDPSVSELLARRALDLARPESDPRPGVTFPLSSACRLALVLNGQVPQPPERSRCNTVATAITSGTLIPLIF